ncbi:MAG: hypothetical protein Q8M66_03155 [Actinomycetota bacterium]|nr:hypothetical protein [Actinomycetota bacterium]MDZ4180196.1 hypothetical protein [Coriobacteriia bacterium]
MGDDRPFALPTWAIWLAAIAVIAFAWLTIPLLNMVGLHGSVTFPISRSYFNAMYVLWAPLSLIALETLACLGWAARKHMGRSAAQLVILLVLFPLTLVLGGALLQLNGSVSPWMQWSALPQVFFLTLPACGVVGHLVLARDVRFLRTVGVALLAWGIGVTAFLVLNVLLGAETN